MLLLVNEGKLRVTEYKNYKIELSMLIEKGNIDKEDEVERYTMHGRKSIRWTKRIDKNFNEEEDFVLQD